MESVPYELILYIIFGGVVQLAAALLAAPVLFALGHFFFHRSFRALLRAYLVFNGFLLFWGCWANYAWLCLTLDKMYVSADRLVDCLPFIPFGQWVLNQSLGHVTGRLIAPTTLPELRLIWLTFAAAVWLLTYLSTVYLDRIPFVRWFTLARVMGLSIAGFGFLSLPGIRNGFRNSGGGPEIVSDARAQISFALVLVVSGAAVVLGSFADRDRG